jgi:hypothetical protein
MATVRMTTQMSYDIEKKAMEAWDKINLSPTGNPELASKIRVAVNRVPLIAKLIDFGNDPIVQENLKYKTRLTSTVRPFDTRSEITQVLMEDIPCTCDPNKTSFSLTVALDTPISIPAVEYWMTFDISFYQLDEQDRNEIMVHANNAYEKEATHSTARHDFRESILHIIRSCNTVKQLLDVWPAAEKLLSPETIQKLHTKVTRKIDANAVRERANFDPNAANQIILTSALLGD